jgi:hypothetical protein
MADLATRVEVQQGRALTPDEIFEITRAWEKLLRPVNELWVVRRAM